jgi:hypothetical protein
VWQDCKGSKDLENTGQRKDKQEMGEFVDVGWVKHHNDSRVKEIVKHYDQ